MAIVQISAGSQRSVALDGKGAAWGWGAFKTAYPGLQNALPAALCSTDKSEVGHRRYAQPYAQMLNPGTPFRPFALSPMAALTYWGLATPGACWLASP